MFLGALIDAGCPVAAIEEPLVGLPDPVTLTVKQVTRGGLRGTLVKVTGPEGGPRHRSYTDLASIMSVLPLPADLRQQAEAVLRRLAAAEAAVHGVPVEQVHFHELGGLDTIADIVGTVSGLRYLGVKRLTCSPFPLSHGRVDTAHGPLPVPPPAVMQLLRGVPTRPLDLEGETVTPTGAALAVSISEGYGLPPPMILRTVAYGAGSKDFPEAPNLVRLLLGDSPEEPSGLPPGRLASDDLVLLETNIDDMNPELQPALLTALFTAGALDAWLTPIVMKKGRPALLVAALTPPDRAEAVTTAFLEHSTTFGVRVLPCARRCLGRERRQIETPWGPVAVKVGLLDDRPITASPEYEDCARLAAEQGVPVKRVYAAALGQAQELLC